MERSSLLSQVGTRFRQAIGIEPLHTTFGPPVPFDGMKPGIVQMDQEHDRGAKGLGFDILPDLFQGKRFGITDSDKTTIQRQRQVFRGLSYRCSIIRANAFIEIFGTRVKDRIRVVRTNEDMKPVEDTHPWLPLLFRPNPTYSARYIWRWAQQSKDSSRGAFFFIEWDKATRHPRWLHPVFPYFGTVEPVGNGYGGIAGYIFWRIDGQRFPKKGHFDPRMVCWLRHPHPVSPYESASVVEAGSYELDVDLYMQVYRRDTLRKGGMPKMYLTTNEDMTPDQADQWARRFMQYYLGYENLDKVPAFGNGAELKTLVQNARDLEFIQGAQLTATQLLDLWGVPEGVIHDKANRANAEAALYTFATKTAQPEADDNCDQLTTDFREAFDADINLVIQAPDLTPTSQDDLLRWYDLLIKNGALTPDELREMETGKDPFGGDASRPHISATLRPLPNEAEVKEQQEFLRRASGGDGSVEDAVVRGLLEAPTEAFNAVLSRIEKQ